MSYQWDRPPYRWADLVNSDFHDYLGGGADVDRLEIDAWLTEFLELCDYGSARLPDRSGRARLRRLRSIMTRIVRAILHASKPAAGDIAALNRFLQLSVSRPFIEYDRGHFTLQESPSHKGLDRVLGDLARGFAATISKGELDRLKLCANPDCRWVMYDESRNRTRRWCDVTVCGNVVKVRQFRARQRRRSR